MECYTSGMALFMRQDDNRSELQQRLQAELQEKNKKKHELENQPRPDGVKDANYMRDFSGPSKYLWVWLVLTVAIIAAIILFIALG